MKTFDRKDNSSKIKFLFDHIKNYKQIGLATVGKEKGPWSVCVNFDIDENFNIFRKSNRNSRHSQDIDENPLISILIFGEHEDYDFALYSTGKANEVIEEKELNKLIKIKYHDKGRTDRVIDDFRGESRGRIYSCKLDEIYVADIDHKKSLIDIDALRSSRQTISLSK